MIELLIAITAGILAGTFTGLIPGIHVNLVSVVVLSFSPVLIPFAGVTAVVLFIISMAVTHTFIDVLPSIFLGAPDAAMALSVLPGHKLLREGRGIEAVRLTQVGSLSAIILSSFLFVGFVFLIRSIETYLDFIPLVLLGLVLFLLLQDFKIQTVILFLLSGVLGVLTFRLPGLENSLFPLLTGLFGISTLLLSMSATAFPDQKNKAFTIKNKLFAHTVTAGQSVGFVSAFMPGLGAASAAALAEPFVQAKEEGFLLLVGTISTVNFVLYLATFYVLEKARIGAVVAVK
jgi:putative membrane protein